MRAKNAVIAGEYAGALVKLSILGKPLIQKFFGTVPLNKNNVQAVELAGEEHYKSAANGIARGLVGNFLVGPVGLLAGLTAKTKNIYHIAIQFKDGNKSLLEVDKNLYQAIMKRCL
jgi:hypothetical protein